MASGKNKKMGDNDVTSTATPAHGKKKTSKFLKPEPKIGKKISNKDSGPLEANTASPSLANKKTPKSLKPENNFGKKSLDKGIVPIETDVAAEVKGRNEDGKMITEGSKADGNNKERGEKKNSNSSYRGKEKHIRTEDDKTSQKDQKAEGKREGLIFMCSGKTKPDCFRYNVMGVSVNKKEIVTSIRPGLKLFLYDFDLKLMYGIYEASSPGGMKLEPAAFGGAFPAQVRFKVYKDCLPLPESEFKKAIKDNYDERTHKFRTELTVPQVKKLMALFHPAPWLNSNSGPFAQSLPAPVMLSVATMPQEKEYRSHGEQLYGDHYGYGSVAGNIISTVHEDRQLHKRLDVASPSPLFLTEKEYRSHGLQRERHMFSNVATPVASTLYPYRAGQENDLLMKNPGFLSKDKEQRESTRPNLIFLSEKEYRAHGLKGRHELPTSVFPATESNPVLNRHSNDPHDPYHESTNSLVNRYLSLPRTATAPPEPPSLTRREAYFRTSDYPDTDRTYLRSPNYHHAETRNYPRGVVPDNELYPTYPPHSLSDYDQEYHRLRSETESTSAPVSARYSFAGPSVLYR